MLQKLFPYEDLKKTLARFQLSSVCAVFVFAVLFVQNRDIADMGGEVVGRFIALGVMGYLWFGALRIFAESRSWSGKREGLVGTLVFLPLIVAVFFMAGTQLLTLLLYVIGALLLLVTLSPYIGRGNDISYWFFSRKTWFGILIAIFAGLLWGAGISAAFAAVGYLFDISLGHKIYADVWAFALVVFAPLYALAWVPEQFAYREEDCTAPPQLQFMLNWVLAPLTIVYMLILYAYFVKIGLAQELPRGQLSYLIAGFGGVGVMTYMAGWPLREQGGGMLRFVCRWFFPALIIPALMQGFAIGERIAQYGVTEQRYAIVLCALWFFVIAVGFTVRKLPFRAIPLTLAALFVLGSVGPWGAYSVSGYSQTYRLEKLFNEYGILKEGGILGEPTKDVPFAARKDISQTLEYMRETDRKGVLRQWFGLQKRADIPPVRDLVSNIGVGYAASYESERGDGSQKVNWHGKSQGRDLIHVAGYDYVLLRVNAHQKKAAVESEVKAEVKAKAWEKLWDGSGDQQPAIALTWSDGVLSVATQGREVALDFDEPVAALFVEKDGQYKGSSIVLHAPPKSDFPVKVEIFRVNGHMKDSKLILDSVGFHVFIGSIPSE